MVLSLQSTLPVYLSTQASGLSCNCKDMFNCRREDLGKYFKELVNLKGSSTLKADFSVLVTMEPLAVYLFSFSMTWRCLLFLLFYYMIKNLSISFSTSDSWYPLPFLLAHYLFRVEWVMCGLRDRIKIVGLITVGVTVSILTTVFSEDFKPPAWWIFEKLIV